MDCLADHLHLLNGLADGHPSLGSDLRRLPRKIGYGTGVGRYLLDIFRHAADSGRNILDTAGLVFHAQGYLLNGLSDLLSRLG